MTRLMMLAIVAAGCLAWAPAQAKDYILVNDDGESLSLLDRESFKRVDAATMSGLSIDIYRDAFVVDDTKRDETVLYAKCGQGQFGIKSLSSFDKDGKSVFDMSFEDDEVQYIPTDTGTVGAMLVGLICGESAPSEDDVIQAQDVAELQAILDEVFASEEP